MEDVKEVNTVLTALKKKHNLSMLGQFSDENPFMILISTVLSARTKDTTTIPIARRLFSKLKTPEDFLKVNVKTLEKMIYGVGFYPTKARRIKQISRILIEKYGGKVPDEINALLSLPGVGRKTANCVLVYAYRKPSIPVDTHVHRISNRLGWVKTRKPEETEIKLMKLVPRKSWIDVNELFVTHGQTICAPISPFCSKCPIYKYCKRIGVKAHR